MNAPPLDHRVTVLEFEVRQLKLRLARVEHEGDGLARVSTERTPRPVREASPVSAEPATVFVTHPPAVEPAPPSAESVRPVDLPLPPPLPAEIGAHRLTEPATEQARWHRQHDETPAWASLKAVQPPVDTKRSAAAGDASSAVTTPSFGERLRGWGLLPPADGNREVALGAWWATRIGALLGVLAAVFLAVYVSINTPPWVRWLELLALALGVTAAGLRFDRTIERFGRVVLGCGLSLIYFTAVAGYAVAGVRVFRDLGSASMAQACAIAILLAVSLWKNSEKLTALSVGYGVIAALWARSLDNPALGWTALSVLLGVSLALRNVRQWALPALLAVPAAYFALLIDVRRLPGTGTGFAIVGFAWLVAWLTEVRLARANAGDRTAARVLLSLNASGALLACAGLTTHRLHGQGDLVSLVAGLVCLGAAYVHFRHVPARWGFAWHYTKGASLLVLATILYFDGPARWFSLLAQAYVWLFSARRNDSRLLLGGSIAAACIAALNATTSWDGYVFVDHSPAWGYSWLVAAGIWVHLLLRGTASPLLAWRSSGDRTTTPAWSTPRTTTETLTALALLGTGLHLWWHTVAQPYSALVPALVALPLAAAGWLLRERVALACAAVAATVAALWAQPPLALLPWQPAAAAGLTAIYALAAGAFLGRRVAEAGEVQERVLILCGLAGGVLLLSTAALAGLGAPALLVAGILSGAFFLLQHHRPATSTWATGAALGAPLGFLIARCLHGPLALTWGQHALLIAAAALAALLPPTYARREPGSHPWSPTRHAGLLESIFVGLWSLVTFVALRDGVAGATPDSIIFSLATAVVLAAGAGRRLVSTARIHAILWLGLALVEYLVLRFDHGAAAHAQALAVLLAAAVLASGVFARQWASPLSEEVRLPGLWATAALGAVLLLDAGWLLQGPAHAYVTAAWGFAGILLFAGGLFGRWRPWRFCGLALLAVATLRLFAIDITSTLSRIFAFAALAVVLLSVGFLYQKFQARIEKE